MLSYKQLLNLSNLSINQKQNTTSLLINYESRHKNKESLDIQQNVLTRNYAYTHICLMSYS